MPVTVFHKDEIVARAEPADLAHLLRDLGAAARGDALIAFDDDTGMQVDLDATDPAAPRPRGRPALGVEAREVTLLPRHWQWLGVQPGGASVTLRKLVDAAMRARRTERECIEAACRFLTVMAGERPGCAEAIRALQVGDRENFDALCVLWPSAVAGHARNLAWPRDRQEQAA